VSTERGGFVDTTTGAMTNQELISRPSTTSGPARPHAISHFRAAAEDIARACDQRATQREIAEGVGKSPAWVNRLLKWREGGYVGAPFADKVVQGVNKEPVPLEPPSIKPAPPAVLDEINADALAVQETINPEAAMAPATKTLTAARAASDYHLPQELNRQDPERAFQRLAEQWSSIPFHDLFFGLAAGLRNSAFCVTWCLPEMGGLEALKLPSYR